MVCSRVVFTREHFNPQRAVVSTVGGGYFKAMQHHCMSLSIVPRRRAGSNPTKSQAFPLHCLLIKFLHGKLNSVNQNRTGLLSLTELCLEVRLLFLYFNPSHRGFAHWRCLLWSAPSQCSITEEALYPCHTLLDSRKVVRRVFPWWKVSQDWAIILSDMVAGSEYRDDRRQGLSLLSAQGWGYCDFYHRIMITAIGVTVPDGSTLDSYSWLFWSGFNFMLTSDSSGIDIWDKSNIVYDL